jgi:short-subunit dehydrogenase
MQRILIIGATSAIASACARLWAEQGNTFFLVARNEEKLQQTAADLQARGAHATTTYLMDALDISAHAGMLKECLSNLQQIDIALIAHGTLPNQETCEENVEIALRELASNGTSAVALLTILANQFAYQRSGTLAVISSVAGDRGRPSNYLYGAAKASVSTFCEGLRARLFKSGVAVVDIKPGFVETPMTRGLPLPAILVSQPERVARIILTGIERKKAVVYAPGFWAVIMLIMRHLPQFIFKRLSL